MVVDPNSSVYTMNSKTQHNMWHGLCENLQREFDISSNVRFIIVPIILVTYSVTKGEVLFCDMNRKCINFMERSKNGLFQPLDYEYLDICYAIETVYYEEKVCFKKFMTSIF